jgi:hypothetical protein
MRQFLFVSASILSAIGKIGNKCGPLFEAYVEEALPHYINFLKADFEAAAETIPSIAEIIDGLKNVRYFILSTLWSLSYSVSDFMCCAF